MDSETKHYKKQMDIPAKLRWQKISIIQNTNADWNSISNGVGQKVFPGENFCIGVGSVAVSDNTKTGGGKVLATNDQPQRKLTH